MTTPKVLSSTTALVDQFMVSRTVTCRPASLTLYRHVLGAFALDHPDPSDLSPDAISAYLGMLRERDLSDQTVRGHYRMLKTLCRWLVDHDLLDRDPFAGRGKVATPPLRRRRQEAWSHGDIARLLTATGPVHGLRTNFVKQRIRFKPGGAWEREALQARALVLVLADTAMRAGEVASLSCRQIRADELVIEGKGGHEGLVFLHPTTRAVVEELIAGRDDDDAVFLDFDGNRAATREIRGIIVRLAKRAGVEPPERPVHSFRHYAARKWTAAKLSSLAIQQLMRHANVSTTMLYVGLDASELARLHQEASPVDDLMRASGLERHMLAAAD